MKNQYFGDVNDYLKYGLLRHLTGKQQVPLAVCWMLTADQPSPHGHRTRYLCQRPAWRCFDEQLYDFLHDKVLLQKIRNVDALEGTAVLGRCRFYSSLLPDNSASRDRYYERFLETARGAALVFMDPDIGMETKSTPRGRKGSSQYLYWEEVGTAFGEGHSLLIYQHFRRKRGERRPAFIACRANQFLKKTLIKAVHSFSTPHAVFFLIPRPEHQRLFANVHSEVAETWRGKIRFELHI